MQGYRAGNAIFAVLGPWVVVTNKGDLAKTLVDRHLDPVGKSLSDAEWYVGRDPSAVPAADNAVRLLSVAIDLHGLRERFPNNDLFQEQAHDFGAELILGGILTLLRLAPIAEVYLDAEPGGLVARAHVPTQVDWFSPSREHYVGPGATGRALPPLGIEGAIASMTTYRNLSELWLRAGDLFDERVNDQLAQADNTLTTLFSGKDFGEDILGALEPEVRMVVAPQAFAEGTPAPAIRLPAFGLVAKLKHPEAMQRELKRIFQSFIGFLNIVGAMEGRPQLDLSSRIEEGRAYYWADYVADADRSYENGLPILYNFSPAIAFAEDFVAVASTSSLAEEMADRAAAGTSAVGPESPIVHTLLEVDGPGVREALERNRDAMIAQNMLEKGHTRAEASREIGTLLQLLQWMERAQLTMSFGERSELALRVDAATESRIPSGE
jgi:hypothetical protein